MGQTLTHGIYLPDEGERNCYNGLAGNWTILDGAVGTVAEHTTQIAGKAPAVHTHVKADITDFPAYGTTAGTICEGNDSRLSDARTPVAHTHGKADITDLFNSSNTWTSWQTLENTNANALLRLRRTDIKIGDAIPSAQKEIGSISFAGSDNINLGLIATRDESNGHTRLIFAARQRYDSNGNRANNGNSYEVRINLGIDESHKYYLSPNTNGDIDLGTSTNKWKTINEINPGALSLPDTSRVTDIDTTGWTFNGSTANQIKINNATQTLNGWLYIRLSSISATDFVIIRYSGSSAANLSFGQRANANGDPISITVPVVANVPTYVYVTAEPAKIRFFLSLGEVNNLPSS